MTRALYGVDCCSLYIYKYKHLRRGEDESQLFFRRRKSLQVPMSDVRLSFVLLGTLLALVPLIRPKYNHKSRRHLFFLRDIQNHRDIET